MPIKLPAPSEKEIDDANALLESHAADIGHIAPVSRNLPVLECYAHMTGDGVD